MVDVGEETNENVVGQLSSLFSGGIVVSEQSVPRWGPLFDLTGNHVQVVLYALEMLTSMRLVKGLFGGSYC